MTTLIARYQAGETKQVYAEIQALGQDAFLPENFPAVEAVLIETFERVAHNLQVIYTALQATGYVFVARPLHPPLPGTEKLLQQLDDAVRDYGYVPLSLKYFYKIAGGVDFAWDYDAEANIPWKLADPIQISSLDELVPYVADADWREYMHECMDDENGGAAFLELSADDLHKDNISGGMPYSLRITAMPAIDSDFMFEPHQTTFINYLRICFEYCGFAGNPDEESYRAFVASVKPKLKPI
jgi:hypothetical protein